MPAWLAPQRFRKCCWSTRKSRLEGTKGGAQQASGILTGQLAFNGLTDDEWIGIMHHMTRILDEMQR
jgi:hypothetical protein